MTVKVRRIRCRLDLPGLKNRRRENRVVGLILVRRRVRSYAWQFVATSDLERFESYALRSYSNRTAAQAEGLGSYAGNGATRAEVMRQPIGPFGSSSGFRGMSASDRYPCEPEVDASTGSRRGCAEGPLARSIERRCIRQVVNRPGQAAAVASVTKLSLSTGAFAIGRQSPRTSMQYPLTHRNHC